MLNSQFWGTCECLKGSTTPHFGTIKELLVWCGNNGWTALERGTNGSYDFYCPDKGCRQILDRLSEAGAE